MTKELNVGKVLLTPAIEEKMHSDPAFQRFVTLSLGKHIRGNWGNISPEDRRKNDEAVDKKERIESSYNRPGVPKDDPFRTIRIATEADRSATTILFPHED